MLRVEIVTSLGNNLVQGERLGVTVWICGDAGSERRLCFLAPIASCFWHFNMKLDVGAVLDLSES